MRPAVFLILALIAASISANLEGRDEASLAESVRFGPTLLTQKAGSGILTVQAARLDKKTGLSMRLETVPEKDVTKSAKYLVFIYQTDPEKKIQVPTLERPDKLVGLEEHGRVHDRVLVLGVELDAQVDRFVKVRPDAGIQVIALALSDAEEQWLRNVEGSRYEMLFAAALSLLPKGKTFDSEIRHAPLKETLKSYTEIALQDAGKTLEKGAFPGIGVSHQLPLSFLNKAGSFYLISRKSIPYSVKFRKFPPACDRSLDVVRSPLENLDLGEYTIRVVTFIARSSGELPFATCTFEIEARAYDVETANIKKAVARMVFKSWFDKKKDFAGADSNARIHYSARDPKAAKLLPEIVRVYDYMGKMRAFGRLPQLSEIHLFPDGLEVYLATGRKDSFSIPGRAFFNSVQGENCPAVPAHEINHLFYMGAYERLSKDPKRLELPKGPLWLIEGSANLYARKATGYYLYGESLLDLLEGIPESRRLTPMHEAAPIITFNDLEQVLGTPPLSNLESRVEGILIYGGSAAFFEYADARFGPDAQDALLLAYRENGWKDPRKSVSKAWKTDYEKVRSGFNGALAQTKNVLADPPATALATPTPGPERSRSVDIEEIIRDADSMDCKDPSVAWKDMRKAQRKIDSLKSGLEPAAACAQPFLKGLAEEKRRAKVAPVFAVIRAVGLIDAAKSAGCVKEAKKKLA